jgi:hypothetical protein
MNKKTINSLRQLEKYDSFLDKFKKKILKSEKHINKVYKFLEKKKKGKINLSKAKQLEKEIESKEYEQLPYTVFAGRTNPGRKSKDIAKRRIREELEKN